MNAETLLHELTPIQGLEGVIHWAYRQTPPAEFVDVVIQDEYTHDVVVRAHAELYAVFDAT
jgi:hypothetical protein